MSTNKTQNYQLHGWASEDEFPRSELNANFTKLDTALKAEETARVAAVAAEANARTTGLGRKVEMVVGKYTGDGAASQTINLGFTPKAVFVMYLEGEFNDDYRTYCGMAVAGGNMVNEKKTNMLTLVAGGFTAHYNNGTGNGWQSPYLNADGRVYGYVALR